MQWLLQVVTKPTPWDGGYVGVNSFGFGGANTHCILKSNTSHTTPIDAQSNQQLPKIVCVSGRTEESVSNLLRVIIIIFYCIYIFGSNRAVILKLNLFC